MRTEHRHFHVSPIVVPSGERTTITVQVLSKPWEAVADGTYELLYLTRERPDRKGKLAFTVHDGGISFEADFPGEQEHVFRLEMIEGDERTRVGEFRIYSVEDDLLRLRPLKGDFHLHTCHSDGLESPVYVAARCREIGFDFMAITDHHKYAPSEEAMEAYAETDADLKIYPGEEVHPPGNPVHMVNFGSGYSVNALFADSAAYDAAVNRQLEENEPVPDGVDPVHYASTVWALDQIRKGDGLAVFCHPYWVANGRYPVDGRLTDHILAEKPFDALEVIGGYHKNEGESNALQVARYHEERAKGNDCPIVGLSDSHGCDTGSLFGWYYTIVFAENAELPTLIDAIKDLHSVAVEHVKGEQPRVHGHFRLTKFVHFLLREYFPMHDRLCSKEGLAMLDHSAGKPKGAEELSHLKGQCAALHDQLYSATS